MKIVTLLVTLAATPAPAEDLLFFHSPSGNIHCLIATGDYPEARCDMRVLTPSHTTPPADCDLDWGAAFAVARESRKGYLACVGDTVEVADSVELGYGQSLSLGGITCTSEKTGVSCTNPAGHGFALAKARQKLF